MAPEISSHNVKATLLGAGDIFGPYDFLVQGLTEDSELIEATRLQSGEVTLEKLVAWATDDSKRISTNWVSYAFVSRLVNRILQQSGDPRIMRLVGAGAPAHLKGLRFLARATGDTEAIYEISSMFNSTMNRISDMWISGRAAGAVRIDDRYHIDLRQVDCDYTWGVFEGAPLIQLPKKPAAIAIETHCQAKLGTLISDLNGYFGGDYHLENEGDAVFIRDHANRRQYVGKHVLLAARQDLPDASVFRPLVQSADRHGLEELLMPKENVHYSALGSDYSPGQPGTAFLCEKPLMHNGREVLRQGQSYECERETAQIFFEPSGWLRKAAVAIFMLPTRMSTASKTALMQGEVLAAERDAAISYAGQRDKALRELEAAHADLEAAHSALQAERDSIAERLRIATEQIRELTTESFAAGIAHEVRNLIGAANDAVSILAGQIGANPVAQIRSSLESGLSCFRAAGQDVVDALEKARDGDTGYLDASLGSFEAQYNQIGQTLVSAGRECASLEGHVNLAHVSILKTLTFVHQVFSYTRIREAVQHESLHPKESISHVIQMLEAKRGNATIITEYLFDSVVYMNPLHLEQAAYNLISNALDAVNGNGTVSVRTYPAHVKGRDVFGFEVADDGKGIRLEHINEILLPLKTFGKETGIGMGLPITNRIVTSYDGEMTIKSEYGKGSTFTFYIPLGGGG